MEPVKNFTRYLLDNGLIFEINRKILHPLGLALVVETDFKSDKKIVIRELLQTDDEEGFLFDEESFNEGSSRYNKFLDKFGDKKLEKRKELLGFIEQIKGDI